MVQGAKSAQRCVQVTPGTSRHSNADDAGLNIFLSIRSVKKHMNDVRIFDPAWLREQAAHCRDLAEVVSSVVSTAEELREIAVEYDADAANIESEGGGRSLASPQS